MLHFFDLSLVKAWVFFNPGTQQTEAPQERRTGSCESTAAQGPDHSPGTAPEHLNCNTNVFPFLFFLFLSVSMYYNGLLFTWLCYVFTGRIPETAGVH